MMIGNRFRFQYAVADVEQADGPFQVSNAIDEKLHDREGWAVGGHQQTGPRNAWFVVPALQTERDPKTRDPHSAEVPVSLQCSSVRRIQLSLGSTGPVIPGDQRIQLGSMHTVGPFPLEAPRFGYQRDYASLKREFKADQVFTHTDRPYRWHHRADLPQVEVNQLPIIPNKASVTVLHQAIQSPKPQKLTLLIGTDDGHTIYLNGKQVGEVKGPNPHSPLSQQYKLDLKQGNNRLYIKVVNHDGPSALSYAFRAPAMSVPARLVELVNENSPSKADRQSIRSYYRKVYCQHPEWLALLDYEKGLVKAQQKVRDAIPTTLVWKELSKPREARLLNRGQYDQPGDVVPRATPGFLPAFPGHAPNDRLGLARWLVSPQHPLTARVAVNRFWQQVFGIGLVRTSEDFGSQGEPPSHRQLLDWLAVDFRENGWDVKRLMKQIVTSQAYRRSAHVTSQMIELDPENRLLARGPRFRLDAEVIRDQALALSGLLNDRAGGPGVKPPQPDGLWSAVGYTRSNTARFIADTGDKTFRRSVYIFWKRTSAPPQMSTLDAPSRESCTVRRERTNTPLQALLLLNETQLFLAAKHLAMRTLANDQLQDTRQRIAWLFETVTLRPADEQEIDELAGLVADLSEHYGGDEDARRKIDPGRFGAIGRLDDCCQCDVELGRSRYEVMPMDPQHQLNLTRRAFFAKGSAGLGAAALASIEQQADAASGARRGLPHHAPKANRAIYLFMSGAPSQMDMWDYKPAMGEMFDKDLPDSVRMGQRLTTMTSGQQRFPIAPSIYQFSPQGSAGTMVSELLPHMSTKVDDIALIKSMHTEAINHDPAITYICTGHQLPGKASLGAWLSYGLGTENENLPAFLVMTATWTGRKEAQALYNRLWGKRFLAQQVSGCCAAQQWRPGVVFVQSGGRGCESSPANARFLGTLESNHRRQDR